MKRVLAGVAFAASMMAFGGAASASMCSNDCDHSYGVCNGLNGGNAQQICMPKWMQCKKACNAPVTTTNTRTTATKISTVSKPKH